MQASSLSTGLARPLPHPRSRKESPLGETLCRTRVWINLEKEAPAPHERSTGQRFLYRRRFCRSDVIHLGWPSFKTIEPAIVTPRPPEHVAKGRSAPGAHRQQVRNPLLESLPALCRCGLAHRHRKDQLRWTNRTSQSPRELRSRALVVLIRW